MQRNHSTGAVVGLKKVGLLPFTTVGFLILLIAVVAIAQYQWSAHQCQMEFIEGSATNELVTDMTSRLNELEREARSSLYEVLWVVGKNAYKFEDEEDRQNMIENWASSNFQRSLSCLAQADEKLPHQCNLKLGRGITSFQLEACSGDYPRASIELPENTSIFGRLPDNSLSLELPIEKLKTTVDVRYYLLRDRMKLFRMGEKAIEGKWKYLEYGAAYAQAWIGGSVDLNESRSHALFQISWASHEFSNFGSSDYFATALSLTGLSQDYLALPGYGTNIVEPLKKEEIEKISKKIDESISYLKRSSRKLQAASNKAEELKGFELGDHDQKILGRLTELNNQINDLSSKEASQEFRDICKDSKSVYSYPMEKIPKILKEIRRAKEFLEKSEDRFQSALVLMGELSEHDPFLGQLNKSFSEGEGTSERVQNIFMAFDDILIKLEDLNEEVLSLREKLRAPEEIYSIFPAEFPERFSNALKENVGQAKEIILKAKNSAIEAFEKFEQTIEDEKEKVDHFCHRLSKEVEKQTKIPRPNKVEEFKEYPEPGEDLQELPVVKRVEKYMLPEGEETIGGLRRALGEIKVGLDHLADLSEKFGSEQGELHEFVVKEKLKKALMQEAEYRLPLELNREQFYEISPPKPLKDEPNISVYHEVKIKDVCYTRMDPVGWLRPEAPPTPIYIWPIDITLYWAMWDVRIELKEPVVEEIFDYRNLVVPRPLTEDFIQNFEYVHKPLPYRWKLDKKEFSFPLVIISLREFSIS